jgi:hypothetical protein
MDVELAVDGSWVWGPFFIVNKNGTKEKETHQDPILNNALKYTDNPTSLAKSIATHPTFFSLLPLHVVVPDETSHTDARSTILPSCANESLDPSGSEVRSGGRKYGGDCSRAQI